MRKYFLYLAGVTFLAGCASNHAQEINYPDSFAEPIGHFPAALGDFHYPISSEFEEAQRYFDQGFQMMYSFTNVDAARSFRAAQLVDLDCAICYWGEAWSWGSYLNAPMNAQAAPRAYFAIQQALQRIDKATPKEADMIRALSVRYVQDFDPAQRRVQDEAYADAMAELAAKYPDDLDIVTLYGDSLFLLEERRGYRDLDDPDVIRLHSVLESVLERDIRHPGACHLYIHATESTPKPELAAPCARYLATAIPGASHINHMPSHTWNEMGLWNEAVRSNIMAWHSDQKAAYGEGFAIYPTHNLGMLLYAASMDGQGGIAIQAAKDLAKIGDNSQHVMTLIRFGRFDEVLDVGEKPSGEMSGGIWEFGQAYAALKMGDMETALQHQAELDSVASTTTARYRFHEARNILGTLSGILQGEIQWTQGNLEAAAEAFRQAAEVYDRLDFDEPEPLPFSPRHWLGAAYIELGAYDRAIEVYEQDLREHPHNGWALFGIKQALTAQGKEDADIDARLAASWERSDTWIRSSRF